MNIWLVKLLKWWNKLFRPRYTEIYVPCGICRLYQNSRYPPGTKEPRIKNIDGKMLKLCPLELKYVAPDTEACDIMDQRRKYLYQLRAEKQ